MRGRVVVTSLSLLLVGALSVALALHSSTPRYHSAVTGLLLISGGPAPGTPRPSLGEVTARSAKGQSFSISVLSGGKFTLQLPAGKYTLTGSSPQFGNGQYKCFALASVSVLKGKSIHKDVYCPEN
jgi:hypothetical protein